MTHCVRSRIAWVDIAKGIGICLVALGHTEWLSPDAKKFVYTFHMPLFYFLSGLFFDSKRKRSFREIAFGQSGLLVAWAFFVLVSILRFPIEPQLLPINRRDLAFKVWSFVHGAPFTNLPLWFLVSLTFVIVCFSALFHRVGGFRSAYARMIFLSICAVCMACASLLPVLFAKNCPFMLTTMPAGLFWYASGAFSRRRVLAWMANSAPVALILLGVLAAFVLVAGLAPVEASSVYSMRIRSWRFLPLSLVGIAMTICFAGGCSRALAKPLSFIGRHSLTFFSLDYVVRPYVKQLLLSFLPVELNSIFLLFAYILLHLSVVSLLCIPTEFLLLRFRRAAEQFWRFGSKDSSPRNSLATNKDIC